MNFFFESRGFEPGRVADEEHDDNDEEDDGSTSFLLIKKLEKLDHFTNGAKNVFFYKTVGHHVLDHWLL